MQPNVSKYDPDLERLAEATDLVADDIADPVIKQRLRDIADEVRELARCVVQSADGAWPAAFSSRDLTKPHYQMA